MVTREQIEYLANLSRLEFSDSEILELQGSLDEIIQYMEKLKELDLSDTLPMMHVDSSPRPLRADEVKPGLGREDTFKNAPSVNMGHFSVPKMVK